MKTAGSHTLQEHQEKYLKLNQKFSWLFPPLLEIEFYKDLIVIEYTDKLDKKHRIEQYATPPFSNSRMLIADFLPVQKALKQGLHQTYHRWYRPARLVIVNIKENLADGLSPIEHRVVCEAFLSQPYIRNVLICYQGELMILENESNQ